MTLNDFEIITRVLSELAIILGVVWIVGFRSRV